MKSSAYLVIFISLAAIFFCCSHQSQFREKLLALDSVLVESPDSVYEVLKRLQTEAEGQLLSDRMYYELLKADAQNKAYIDFTTDSVMLNVAEYYDRHGTPNEKLRAYYLLGCTYRDLNDVPMELQYFQEAVERADTTQKDCNWRMLASLYGQMAALYHKQFLPHEELNAIAMCEKYDAKLGDPFMEVFSYFLRHKPYLFLGMQDSVLSVTANARKRFLTIGDTINAARILAPSISVLIDKKRYDEAEEQMKVFEEHSGYFGAEQSINQAYNLYFHDKGRVALHNNETDLAKEYFTKLLTSEKEAAYDGLLAVYENLHIPDSMAKYSRLYATANDTSFLDNNALIVEQMTAMYNYSHQKKIALKNALEHKKAKEVILWLSLGLFAIISTTTIIAIIIYYRNKSKEREFQILFKRLSDTKALVDELEAEKKSIKLTRTINQEQAEQLALLQEELESHRKETMALTEKLNNIGRVQGIADFEGWLKQFRTHETIEKLWTLIVSPKLGNQNATLLIMNLRGHFKKVCPNFVAILSSPVYDLNDLDKRVVMLNICDFSTKDIATLLSKSVQQISNTHNRIKNKMFPSLTNTHQLKKHLLIMLKDSLIKP